MSEYNTTYNDPAPLTRPLITRAQAREIAQRLHGEGKDYEEIGTILFNQHGYKSQLTGDKLTGGGTCSLIHGKPVKIPKTSPMSYQEAARRASMLRDAGMTMAQVGKKLADEGYVSRASGRPLKTSTVASMIYEGLRKGWFISANYKQHGVRFSDPKKPSTRIELPTAAADPFDTAVQFINTYVDLSRKREAFVSLMQLAEAWR